MELIETEKIMIVRSGGGKIHEGGRHVQISSNKISKFWGYNV